MTAVRLTIDVEIDTFGEDHTPEEVEDALRRTSTHSPMDEIEGHLWSELHERGVDSMVTVSHWDVSV
ncbi:MAG: hypothetical protein H0V50_02845 [Thermoleophilaceae bacterium]|nr:hypothetical protein [Thermoleophilaceae bacterium]